MFCKECCDYLCSDCSIAHGRLKVTKGHSVEAVSKPIEATNTCNRQHQQCAEHDETPTGFPCAVHKSPVSFFCINCRETMCPSCLLDVANNSSSRHKNHKIIDLKAAFQERSKDAQAQVDYLKDKVSKSDKYLCQSKDNIKKLEISRKELVQKIQARADALTKGIKSSLELNLEMLDEFYEKELHAQNCKTEHFTQIKTDLKKQITYINLIYCH